MHHKPKAGGWLEVIAGCMYAGKTEELIRRCRRATYAKQVVRIFKPAIDNRYSETDVVTHLGHTFTACPVHSSIELYDMADEADLVGIDEAQFFDPTLVEVAEQLAKQGKRVIVVGLDLDFAGNPFGPMPQLMAVAEYVTKVHAVCVVCGNNASRSQRITAEESQVVVGAEGIYEARCRAHWTP